MRKIRRYAVVFLAGLFGGMLFAQCLIAMASRTGGSFGGEVFPVLALPLFIGAGYSIGRDSRRMGDYDRGYIQGYRDRQQDQQAMAFHTDFQGR